MMEYIVNLAEMIWKEYGTKLNMLRGTGMSPQKLINNTPVRDVRAGAIFDRDPLDTIKKDMTCVTMLGDAIHRKSPFEEQGANQALIDAVTL